jgi:hypothetical protein
MVQQAFQQKIPISVARITYELTKYLHDPSAMDHAHARIEAWRDQASVIHKIRETMTHCTDVLQQCGQIHIHLKNDEERGALLQRVNALRLWDLVKKEKLEDETMVAAQVRPSELG